MPRPGFADTLRIAMPGRTDSILCCAFPVKLDGGGKIHLRENRDIAAVEEGRILQWFVIAFGDRLEDEADIFSQIVGGWAGEIADVFDEQEIEVGKVPAFEAGLHHGGLEMTESAGW